MPRRRAILTTFTFLPLLLCALFWLRSLSTNLYADLTPGTLHFHLASKDSTLECQFSCGNPPIIMGRASPTYWYHDAEGWRLIFYAVHLNEFYPHPAHSTFAWKSLGFYTTASTWTGGFSASLSLPFWFFTLAAAIPPARRLHRLHRRTRDQSAFPIQQSPTAPAPPPPAPLESATDMTTSQRHPFTL